MFLAFDFLLFYSTSAQLLMVLQKILVDFAADGLSWPQLRMKLQLACILESPGHGKVSLVSFLLH